MADDKKQDNALDPAQEIEFLKTKNKAQEERLGALEEGIEKLFEATGKRLEALESNVNNSVDIQAVSKSKEQKKPTCPEFTLDKKRYKFLVPAFIMEGREYVSEDIKDKETLVKIALQYPGIAQAL